MNKIPPIWIPPAKPSKAFNDELSDFPRPMRELFFTRGFRSAADVDQFLKVPEPNTFTAPALPGENRIIELLQTSIRRSQLIVIYGDYDVDGLSSCAALAGALESLGARAAAYIPDRLEEGYGLNKSALKHLHELGTSLVITVDCGIKANREIEYANQLGLPVVITDHHRPGATLPPAEAIINPHLPDCGLESHLAGVGVVYFLIRRLQGHFPRLDPSSFLDLTALGTVADVVPLRTINRSLVHHGLMTLNATRRQGIYSLMRVAGLEPGRINAADIAFQLAPRLNAAGRMSDPGPALALLRSSDPVTSGKLAQKLELLNNQRKTATRQVIDTVERDLPPDLEHPLLFSSSPAFHQGVVGVAAGALSRKYYRPALIGRELEEVSIFSCRSIPEFDITAALLECADILEDFGGHAQAAGCTLRNAKVKEFQVRLERISRRELSGLPLRPRLAADGWADLADLDETLLAAQELLEPTGADNPRPVFLVNKVRLTSVRRVGSSRSHLKCTIEQGGLTLPGIGFGLGHQAERSDTEVDILIEFGINYFRGKKEHQAVILAIRNS